MLVVYNAFVDDEMDTYHLVCCATQFGAVDAVYEWAGEEYPYAIGDEFWHMDDSVTVEFRERETRKLLATVSIEPTTVLGYEG